MSYTIVESCQQTFPIKLKLESKSEIIDQNRQVSNNKINENSTQQKHTETDKKNLTSNTKKPTVSLTKSLVSVSCQVPNKRKSIMEADSIVEFLEKIREPLAEYQEKRGLAKEEHYGFLSLTGSMCRHSYEAILTIFDMLYNLLPLLEAFLYLARFVLDTSIDICQTEDTTDKVIRSVIFLGELVVITFLTMVICGFILFPVWYLLSQIIAKVYNTLVNSAM